MHKAADTSLASTELIIERYTGWRVIDWKELWAYRDLFYFLVTRDIKIRYAQSILGIGWAIVPPLFSMLVFTIVFGKLVRVGSDGLPYALFSYAGLVPWTYFSNALGTATNSLVISANMISKVYFPRLLLPLSAVISKLLDFAIALLLLLLMMAVYQVMPTIRVLALPLLILIMVLSTAGAGMWLTALSIQYRDVGYGMSFGIRMLIYAAPVVYPVSLIPPQYRLLYALNPMVGVIEGFRSALLNSVPMPWDLLAVGAAVALVLFVSGAFYFRRTEHFFADVA